MLDVWVSLLRHSLRHFPEGNLVYIYYIYKKIQYNITTTTTATTNDCKIEDFAGTYLCDLCVILRSRVLLHSQCVLSVLFVFFPWGIP